MSVGAVVVAHQVGWRRSPRKRLGNLTGQPVGTENLYPDVVVMKSAKDRVRIDASCPLNRARDRRVFVQ